MQHKLSTIFNIKKDQPQYKTTFIFYKIITNEQKINVKFIGWHDNHNNTNRCIK